MITFEIEERVFGEQKETLVREVQGTEVLVSEGILQIWDRSSSDSDARLVANVALERLISLSSSEMVIRWDGVERRARLSPVWDGIDRRSTDT